MPPDARGKQRVDDRKVISGIMHVLKSGCRWCDDREDGRAFVERGEGDRHSFRVIVAPEDGDRLSDLRGFIRIHEVLNRADTPREVIEFILIHELLHIEIRPREIDGKRVMHPPEFWEAEARLYPQRQLIWAWFYFALERWLRDDEKREGMMVRRGWHATASQRFPTLEDEREVSEANARSMQCVC